MIFDVDIHMFLHKSMIEMWITFMFNVILDQYNSMSKLNVGVNHIQNTK